MTRLKTDEYCKGVLPQSTILVSTNLVCWYWDIIRIMLTLEEDALVRRYNIYSDLDNIRKLNSVSSE